LLAAALGAVVLTGCGSGNGGKPAADPVATVDALTPVVQRSTPTPQSTAAPPAPPTSIATDTPSAQTMPARTPAPVRYPCGTDAADATPVNPAALQRHLEDAALTDGDIAAAGDQEQGFVIRSTVAESPAVAALDIQHLPYPGCAIPLYRQEIDDALAGFEGAQQAHAALMAFQQRVVRRSMAAESTCAAANDHPRLGEESVVLRCSGRPWQGYVVVWRRGSVLAAVLLIGTPNQGVPQDRLHRIATVDAALALARRQDARLAVAGL
jgi:hypothetical protein